MGGVALHGFWGLAAAVAALIFAAVFLAEWATIYRGGPALVRRLAAFEGDVFAAYRKGVLRGLDRFAHWVGDGAEDKRANNFSASSFLVCLGLAVFYPLFFITVFWALAGGPGTLGTLPLFPEDAPWPIRLLVLASFFLPAAAYAVCRFFLKWPNLAAVAGAFAVAFAGAVAVAVAVAFAVAFAGAYAFAVAGAYAGAGAYAFAVAVAVAALRADAACRGRRWLIPLIALTAIALPLVLVVADGRVWWITLTEWGPYPAYSEPPAWLPDWLAQSPEEWAAAKARWEGLKSAPIGMQLVVFFMFLPALNAPFDWLSLAVTRTLLRWTATPPGWLAGLASLSERIEQAPIVGWIPSRSGELAVIIVDAIIALVLACLVVFATAFGVALLNEAHILGGGAGIGFVVSERIAEIRADPLAKANWWIYAMMFWTLVPTLFHLTIFAAGLVAKFLAVLRIAPWLGKRIEASAGQLFGSLAGAFVLGVLRLAPGFALIALALVNRDLTLMVIGWPFEQAGTLLGFDLPCTKDFTVETLGVCLADGSEAIARWVEHR